jgi:Protein of unknown function (DUF2490)
MASTIRRPVWVALLVLSFGTSALAQSNQVWPETSTFVRLTDQMRFYFLMTTVKEERTATEGEVGPNFDFYLKPLRKLNRWAGFRLDESKNRFLMVRVGYRYVFPYGGEGSDEHRGVVEATARCPLAHGVTVADRSRVDLRTIEGTFSWRYRNRLTVEKDFSIRRFKFTPYGRGEIYYDSRYSKVSRTALIAGSSFPITRHFELESYLEHQNDSGGSSNRTVNAVGMVANLYF